MRGGSKRERRVGKSRCRQQPERGRGGTALEAPPEYALALSTHSTVAQTGENAHDAAYGNGLARWGHSHGKHKWECLTCTTSESYLGLRCVDSSQCFDSYHSSTLSPFLRRVLLSCVSHAPNRLQLQEEEVRRLRLSGSIVPQGIFSLLYYQYTLEWLTQWHFGNLCSLDVPFNQSQSHRKIKNATLLPWVLRGITEYKRFDKLSVDCRKIRLG